MKQPLRPLRENDLAMVLRWRNAPEVRKNMYSSEIISEEEHAEWWQRMQSDSRVRLLIFEDAGEPLGFVSFTNYTGPGGSASWAFYSGDTSRKGIGSMMERAALEFAFGELEVHRLECEVLGFNRPVVDFHLKHGFEVEGVSRDAYQRDGERYSIFRLAMLRPKWERYVRPMLLAKDGVRSTLAGLILRWSDMITSDMTESYSEVTGDNNPIHLKDEAAQAAGFEKKIAHGMLVGGLLSRYFASEFPGKGTVYLSQDLSFRAPVPVGSQIDHELFVQWHIGRKIGVRTLSRVNGDVCVIGEAKLVLPVGIWTKEQFQ
jgi:UDP-4-amino-4,6-dideoxy-N-acetyl-beta-L-altrosamine N-acetyltransferase